jgi:hypothetical protein
MMYGFSWETHELNQRPAWPRCFVQTSNILQTVHRLAASE